MPTKKHTIANKRRNANGSELSVKEYVYKMYVSGAKDRNISFDLSFEQVECLILDNCYYCGVAPQRTAPQSKNKQLKVSGIDRMDNTMGYSMENCVSCCTDCNMAKKTKSVQQFESWASRLGDYLEQRNNQRLWSGAV